MIFEAIITTVNGQNEPHITPFGVRYHDDFIVISPYKPSTTLANILATKCAVLNQTDDVRAFAGALTGHMHFPLVAADKLNGFRMANLLAHQELQLVKVEDDAVRPTLYFKSVHQVNHAPFLGFNRAQAAVVELSILVSRLDRLPQDKVLKEKAYLQIAIDKTAGEREHIAWGWLCEKIDNFYAAQSGQNIA